MVEHDYRTVTLRRRGILGSLHRLRQWLDVIHKGLALLPRLAQQFVDLCFGGIGVAIGHGHHTETGIVNIGVGESGEYAYS